jgi:hypothetical protein
VGIPGTGRPVLSAVERSQIARMDYAGLPHGSRSSVLLGNVASAASGVALKTPIREQAIATVGPSCLFVIQALIKGSSSRGGEYFPPWYSPGPPPIQALIRGQNFVGGTVVNHGLRPDVRDNEAWRCISIEA